MRIGGRVFNVGRQASARLFSCGQAASSTSIFSSSNSFPDHMNFVKDVAAAQPPQHLPHLLRLLEARATTRTTKSASVLWVKSTSLKGDSVVSPGAKVGLMPLAVPLAKSSSDVVTALLRWPTASSRIEMPVVEVSKHGVWLLAKNVDQFIHRILVEDDANNFVDGGGKLFNAAADAGEKLYKKGDFLNSKISDIDVYLLRKVGLFPDVIERKVMSDIAKGDHVSAFVTGDFYTKKKHFPGFARPFVFNAEVLLKVGRNEEARDTARGALKLPWWTLGCKYHEVARIAHWENEQIENTKKKMTKEGKQADLSTGKPTELIALDEAGFLLDLASIEGAWDDCVERIAECYKDAGLQDVAKFVLYRE